MCREVKNRINKTEDDDGFLKKLKPQLANVGKMYYDVASVSLFLIS